MEERIADAIALAQFSNLEISEVENFRNSIAPSFLPAIVWNLLGQYPPVTPGKYLWQQLQHRIRQFWVDGFPSKESVELIVEFANLLPLFREIQEVVSRPPSDPGPDPASPEEIQRITDMTTEQYAEHEREADEAARYMPPKPPVELWPFQLGILFLMMHPQRAVFCPRCGDRFIKLDKNKKYCSRACAQKARLESKLGWWNNKGKKARSKKQSKKKGRSK
jgi:hypothetical protein